MAFKKSAKVRVPVGEVRENGIVVAGPYPAPDSFKQFQLEQFGLVVVNVYDIRLAGGQIATIDARRVRAR